MKLLTVQFYPIVASFTFQLLCLLINVTHHPWDMIIMGQERV
jgi:hypothetical protein